jgi:ribosomal protein S18 acetylase RimI-like enzyme
MAVISQKLITIRKASPEDIATVAKLGADIFTVTFGHSVPADQLQSFLADSYSVAAIENDFKDPMKDLVVASNQEGKIVGFALLTRGSFEPCISHLESTIELQRIYVDPAYHGNGVGKSLANKLDDIARSEGFKHIWLGVWEENHGAQKMYEKLGYRKVGGHDFTIGEIVQTDDIMAKKL